MCSAAAGSTVGMHYTTSVQGRAAFSSRLLCHMMVAGLRRRPPMTTTSDIILLDISDRIATVTLNRPERLNALSGELLDMLPGVIRKVADDEDARCLGLPGARRRFPARAPCPPPAASSGPCAPASPAGGGTTGRRAPWPGRARPGLSAPAPVRTR